ncbi:uncharacterized protein K489DRAFT_188546 [Dissoconium aciculare CBS 342.82]|uniref:Uncharacterized protein n=1 Tax=Dissoconium aciculare CBS 342.82 TaxID=1314786 RepID=A0A6J3M9M2_9PEZI|nr:uncharacterized protein K489DRAFT_188546 [Dissoconium aciculare CBS 342.82]KAF1824730.1 hypothetical protein K489DRAFT_188546 [Dissoconium aciculare CBS 342.82]
MPRGVRSSGGSSFLCATLCETTFEYAIPTCARHSIEWKEFCMICSDSVSFVATYRVAFRLPSVFVPGDSNRLVSLLQKELKFTEQPCRTSSDGLTMCSVMWYTTPAATPLSSCLYQQGITSDPAVMTLRRSRSNLYVVIGSQTDRKINIKLKRPGNSIEIRP